MNQYKVLIEFLNFLNGMISEKELVLSHSLIDILENIDHPLAKFLLDAHHGKDDLGDSYLDTIRDKNDFVSYIGKSVPGEGETEWTSKKRQSTKIGRLLRALLIKKGVEVNDKAIEDFVNAFKIAHNKMFSDSEKTKFELFHGDVIAEWYNESKYYMRPDGKTHSISLYNSCMRYDNCSDFFTIYTKTPNVYLLALIDTESNKLMARAIIWKDIKDFDDESYTFMDRVYSIDDETQNMMIDYAKTQGWVYKTEQSYTSQSFHTVDGSIRKLRFNIDLPKDIDWIEVKKPYMDTIKYLCSDGDGYYLTNDSSISHTQMWNETNGSPNSICDRCDGDGTITCDCDEGYYDCDDCDGDGEKDCSNCDGTGKIDCPDCDEGKYECGECDGTARGADCDTCNGEGEVYEECVDCKGKGVVLIDDPQLTIDGMGDKKQIEVKCKTCKGAGKFNIEECDDCDGIGYAACPYCEDGYCECSNCEDGVIECDMDECDGSGKVRCDYCIEGRKECYECEGKGERDCPECT